MDRRGFLGTILALGAAPAIVRADSLMRIISRETSVLLPEARPILTVGMITAEALRVLEGNLRFIRAYDINKDSMMSRFDVLVGNEQLYYQEHEVSVESKEEVGKRARIALSRLIESKDLRGEIARLPLPNAGFSSEEYF